ncbi:MAG TPA: GatB/YqeY domain-containing protein [Flavobacteriaceae bacterium]|nr:GatB/YqeY domain-containing protein [Flavobacteriaceae bacterium]
MSLENTIMTAMKESMKSKDQTSLRSLRAIKSAIILQKTQKGSSDEISNEDELKILQKLVKQRKDSADIYQNQDRMDLAQPELDEIKIIEKFLPEALSEKEIEEVVKKVINDTGADGMKDMGKVMGIVAKKLMGKADGKTISTIVRNNLT